MKMKLRIRIFMVLLIVFFSSAAKAEPAYWRVDGEEGTLYVLGTMHRLPEGQDWFSDEIRALVNEAEAIVLETENSQASDDYLGFLAQREGFTISRKPLARVIGEETYEAYIEKMASFGVPAERVERYRPWYAALLMSRLGSEKAGYFIRHGAEAVLENYANQHGIALLGLETAAQQMLFFSELPKDSQVKYLKRTLREIGEGKESYDDQFKAWLAGDMTMTADLVLTTLREDPVLYNTLILNRNKAWLEQFEDFLTEGGTYFVAVGTGHLVGPDSVLKMLEDKGYRVTRQ